MKTKIGGLQLMRLNSITINKFKKINNMENNNWEVKWITSELVKSLEYWEKQENSSMELYKLKISPKTISIDETMTIIPFEVNGKRLRMIITEE